LREKNKDKADYERVAFKCTFLYFYGENDGMWQWAVGENQTG
jgi:hypothetical protein